jgi:hypothetical protein
MKIQTKPTISVLLKGLSYSIHCELAVDFVEHVLFLPTYDNTYATEINNFFNSISLYQAGKIDLDTVYNQRWELNELISYNKKSTQHQTRKIDANTVKNQRLELSELVFLNEYSKDCSHSYSVSPCFSKYLQTKMELVLLLYKQCCSKELISRDSKNDLTRTLLKPVRTIHSIAFLSRFLVGLALYGQDWDSINLELRKSVRKKSSVISLEEYHWQIQQINDRLQTSKEP